MNSNPISDQTCGVIGTLLQKLCPEAAIRFDVSEAGTAVLVDPGEGKARARLVGHNRSQYQALRRILISLSAIDQHRYTLLIK